MGGQECTYAVYVWWAANPSQSVSVPITVSGQTTGASLRSYNQQVGGGQWVLHGTYSFAASARPAVQVSNANGRAAADAVRFVLPANLPSAKPRAFSSDDASTESGTAGTAGASANSETGVRVAEIPMLRDALIVVLMLLIAGLAAVKLRRA